MFLVPMAWATRRFSIAGVLLSALLSRAQVTQNTSTNSPSAAPASTASPVAGTPSASTASAVGALPNPLGNAHALFLKGDFDGAIQKYQQILAANPKSPDAYAGLVRIYLKKKDVAQASETVQKALQVADSVPVRVALGEVYFRQGKIPEAERQWIAVINSGRQDARAYMGVARVRWAIAMNKSAWTLIEKAHQLDPTDPEISNLWSARLSRGDRIKYLEDYLANPNNDDAETLAYKRHYLEYLKAQVQNPRNCRLVTRTAATETPMVRLLVDAQHLRGFGLTVGVNNESAKLLLDTGASGITISRRLAEKAGLTRVSETEIGGIGDTGNKSAYIAVANSLAVGNLEFKDCPVRVLDQRSVVNNDGLIGADVFSSFLVDLDFANEKLRLSELPERPGESSSPMKLHTSEDSDDSSGDHESNKAADSSVKSPQPYQGPQDRYIAPEMKSYTQVYRFGHDLLVPTLIGQASTSAKLFLLDSGGFNNVIAPAAANEVTKVHRDGDMNVKGLSGAVKNVYSADKAILQFGHLRQENQDLVAFDLTHLSDELGTEVSGILGFAMLRLLEVEIDYRDDLVDFTYDANHWKWLNH